MTEYAVSIRNLQKHFGPVRAVDGVSLDVHPGEVFGFLGPNGAGKTTTIGMLLGLIHPTNGSIEVLGEPVTPSRTGALDGVGALVGASAALVPYLTARDNLRLVAKLHPHVTEERIDEVLKLVKLEEAADRRAGQFSTGMKQRLGLAMALVHRPALLILDEPTNGMDPTGMREVRNLLRSLAAEGVTVLLSSHLLHEVEQVCDRVAVMNRGRVIAQGEVDELLGGQASVKVRVPDTRAAAQVLAALPGVQEVTPNGAYVTVKGVESERVVEHLVAAGIIPTEVTTARHDLEDIFITLTQESE